MSICSTYTGPHRLDCSILQGKLVDIEAAAGREAPEATAVMPQRTAAAPQSSA